MSDSDYLPTIRVGRFTITKTETGPRLAFARVSGLAILWLPGAIVYWNSKGRTRPFRAYWKGN